MSRIPALLLFWLGALAAVTAQVAIVRAVLAGRAHGVTAERAVQWREIAWVVIPALMLLGVLLATWLSLGRVFPVLPPGSLS